MEPIIQDSKPSNDSLNLSQQPNIISQLSQKQQIKFSTLIQKINDQKMIQQRIFLITNLALYNIAKRSSLIKSLVSKLISFQSKYTIKRKIPFKNIYGITLSKTNENGEFVLHVIDENDYRYCASSHDKKVQLIKNLCKIYTLHTSKKLAFYFKDEIILFDYCTTKTDIKNKIERRPKEDPVYLTSQDFEDYQLPDLNYKLQYSTTNPNINMKNFKPIFQIQKLENNHTYYTISTCTFSLASILEMLKIKSKNLLQPEFVFSTKTKIQLITPFMVGGNLARKLKTCVKISQELAYFYIAQLILILEEFQSSDLFYGNFSLQNIFINQNGYLRIQGIDKQIKLGIKKGLSYNIVGYLLYVPPQMILLKGYSHSANLWRLGVCAYYLLMGCFPFQGTTTKQVYHQILSKKLKSQMPQFLYGLLQRDPKRRICLDQLKKIPKLSHINWGKLKAQTLAAPYQPDTSSWKGNLPSIVHLRGVN